jgi:hypothetical protein
MMRKPSIQWFGQMGAAIGVIISLGLVASELNQSREIAMAELYLDRSALLSEWVSDTYNAEMLKSASTQVSVNPQALSISELHTLRMHNIQQFVYFENQHYLYLNELVTEEEWLASRYLMASQLNPCWARHWEESIGAWRETFHVEVQAMIDEKKIDSADCDQPTGETAIERLKERAAQGERPTVN